VERIRVAAAAILAVAASVGAAWLAPARAQEPASDAPAGTVIEEVLVTGVQPGPGLWRVTRPTDDGGHVLWIMGQYRTLPKEMQWRSTELEAAIAASQELLDEPEIDAEIGAFAGLGALPSLVGVRNNPDGRRLEELMPIQLYARWLELKAEYLGYDPDVEKWRPIFAAFELYKKAVDAAGLTYSPVVWSVAKKSAKKHRVKITTPALSVKVEKPRALIKEFKDEPLDDLECFASTLQRLESDLVLLRARANAWATGDIAALGAMTSLNQASACIDVLMSAQVLRTRGLIELPERLMAAWLAEVERALASNASTVAVLPMRDILRPDGYLARLRASGYVVDGP
jgi:TraB/PrgY/gumN family